MSNEKLLINDAISNNSEFKSNNEEKQIIEEMALIIGGSEIYEHEDYLEARQKAEALYNAGCRKQSVGEWYVNYMMSKKPSKRGRTIQYTTYTCSVCGKPNGRKKSKFCPECGAKMKGGAE